MTGEKVYTVQELREKLEEYPDDLSVKVDADGVLVVPMVHRDGEKLIL